MSFWDSSGIVPLCLFEQRSSEAGRMWKQFPAHFVSWSTPIEIASAIARLEREKQITPARRNQAENLIATLERVWTVVEPLPRVVELARLFPFQYALKAADSIQLASAIVACGERPANADFVSGDAKLLSAAESAGFRIHDLT